MEEAKMFPKHSCTPTRKLLDKCDDLQEALLFTCKYIAEKDRILADPKQMSKKLNSGNIPSCPPSSKESIAEAEGDQQVNCSCEILKSLKSQKVILSMYKNTSKYNDEIHNSQTFCQCKSCQEGSKFLDKVPPISSKDSSIRQEGKLEGNEDADLQNLKDFNQHLKYKNKTLTDELADLQLELKHNIEKIEGPMQRQLCKQQKLSTDLESQLIIASSKKSTSYKREIEFLKKQLLFTNNNIDDLVSVNQELKDEIRVLNFKCDQLQNLIVSHKVNEANEIQKLN